MTAIISVIVAKNSPDAAAAALDVIHGLAPAAAVFELGAREAYDIEIEDADSAFLETARKAVADLPVDVNLVDDEDRKKAILIADMDSTIIQQECIDELADFAGRKSEVAAITERAMAGELDFEGALKERVGMLKGLHTDILEETFEKRIAFTPGARPLVSTMNAHGATTVLVSGGFTFFADKVAKHCGFSRARANTLIFEHDALNGTVQEPILGRAAKEEMLLSVAKSKRKTPENAIAVGDGANDLAMLNRAGLGVAFRAKPAVAAAADAIVQHGDLTALLYLQGYHRNEFLDE